MKSPETRQADLRPDRQRSGPAGPALAGLLAKQIREIEAVSDIWPFDITDYYKDEMGEGLKRQFVSFEGLVTQPDRLAEIKRLTNEIEQRIADDVLDPEIARPVNLDPGYLTLPSSSWPPPRTTRTASTCRLASTPSRPCTTRPAGWQAGRGPILTMPAPPTTVLHTGREALKAQIDADVADPGRGVPMRLGSPWLGGPRTRTTAMRVPGVWSRPCCLVYNRWLQFGWHRKETCRCPS